MNLWKIHVFLGAVAVHEIKFVTLLSESAAYITTYHKQLRSLVCNLVLTSAHIIKRPKTYGFCTDIQNKCVV